MARLIDANELWQKTFICDEVAEVRKFIEQAPTAGAVEVPPVKIGDTVYFIINKKIYEAKICLINWSQYKYTTTTEIRGEVTKYHTVSANFSEWNKSVFATMQQAEEALAKMDGERINDEKL